MAHLPALEAEELIREHGEELTADCLHDLTLQATGDAEAAQQAFIRRRQEELKSGRPVNG